MADDSFPSVLHRMAGISPVADADPAGAPAPGLDRALAEALALLAQAMPGLPLGVGNHACERMTREAALEALPETSTILPMRAPPGEWVGSVVVDASLTDALIEVQTLGRVERAARKPRRPTRIDASFARSFAAGMLERAVGRHGVQAFPALDPSRHLADAAALASEIELPSLVVAELSVTLGAERTGFVRLILPDKPRTALPPPPEKDAEAARKPRQRRDAMPQARVRLEATLPPLVLPLAQLMSLRVGDTIPLPAHAVERLVLGAGRLGRGRPGRKREAALTGRLGQRDGARAVKLTDGVGRDGDEAETAALPPPSGSKAGPKPVALAAEAPKDDAPATDDLPELPSLDDAGELPSLDAMGDLPDLPALEA